MTPAYGAVVVYKLGLFRVLAVVLLVLAVFWHYWVAPKVEAFDRATPWEGAVPNLPDMKPMEPWEGSHTPASCTAPVEARPVGFTGMAHDAGRLLRGIAEGPPSGEQMVGWFRSAGTGARTTWVAFEGGVEGQQLLPVAPTTPPPAAVQVGTVQPVAACVSPTAPQGTWASGDMPDTALVAVQGGRLRTDVAAAFAAMAAAFERDLGKPLTLTSGYRSRQQQAALYAQHRARGSNLAAPPGRSNHGLGLAVDLGAGVQAFGTTAHRWMQLNAGAYGFVHPSWAQQGGSKPEAWHWEYVSGDVTVMQAG